jgi:predicted nucleic acid-binding protein
LDQSELANDLFFHSFNSNLSFTDCQLVATAKICGAEILTFDKQLETFWKKHK